VRNHASPASKTPRTILRSESCSLVYPSNRWPAFDGVSSTLPIASPTSLGAQGTQKPASLRTGSSLATSNRTRAAGNRCARNAGMRPMAPGLPSTLNIDTLPSVEA